MNKHQQAYVNWWRKKGGVNFFDKIALSLHNRGEDIHLDYDLFKTDLHKYVMMVVMSLGTNSSSVAGNAHIRAHLTVIDNVHCSLTLSYTPKEETFHYMFTALNVFEKPLYDIIGQQVRFLV